MTQRGGPQHFLFKYAPLRLRGAANQPRMNSTMPFNPRISFNAPSGYQTTPPSIQDSPDTVEPQVAENSPNILSSSLENIKIVFQRQEQSTGEIKTQLDVAKSELERLKTQFENSLEEIEQLRYANQKLTDSQQHLDEEIEGICKLYSEVKTMAQDAAQTIAEIEKDRESWLSNFEDVQRKHYDKRVKLLQSAFQKTIDDKETLLEEARCQVEQLLVQFRDTSAERDQLKEQFTETKSTLDRFTEDNLLIHQERVKFKTEWMQLKDSFDELLSERIANVVEESLQVKVKYDANANELKELTAKWTSLRDECQKTTSELTEMKILENSEPRESLKSEISSLREQIRQLNNVNDIKEAELGALRDKLVSIQQAVSTYEDVKRSLNILSKERAVLQEQHSLLEKECISTKEALAESKSQANHLEMTADELNKKLQDECKKAQEKEMEVQELNKKLSSFQQMDEEKRVKLDELVCQLTLSEERNHNLQIMLDEKVRSQEDILAHEKNSQQLKANLEKEITELKSQLMATSIQLQYKEKRMEETEEALSELKSKVLAQGESTRPEADKPKSKTKTELEKLKTAMNLKNLEVESVNEELKEAQKTIAVAERKITDLELMVSILERKLESERLQASSNMEVSEPTRSENSDHPMLKEPVGSHALHFGMKQPATPQEKATIENLETLTLFQKANAMAKAEELKRNKSGKSNSQMMKPPSPPSLPKRRRMVGSDKEDGSHASPAVKIDQSDFVAESPVIRNLSGVRTSRYLSRSRSSSNITVSMEPPIDEKVVKDSSF